MIGDWRLSISQLSTKFDSPEDRRLSYSSAVYLEEAVVPTAERGKLRSIMEHPQLLETVISPLPLRKSQGHKCIALETIGLNATVSQHEQARQDHAWSWKKNPVYAAWVAGVYGNRLEQATTSGAYDVPKMLQSRGLTKTLGRGFSVISLHICKHLETKEGDLA
ncbi:hypothetical protein Y1Q_0016409 [Alligator mississippiensis]|uniref:Uncharacterized protein n=1 Tax=Alligator mississippiensis TaxID=8496 RepID=A0A151N334_ALLMI|nr:hypothetical protein Y1Q_0016409 [Alligator mississippiensis]